MKKVLFLGKADDIHTAKALEYCRQLYDVDFYLGRWGDPFPKNISYWRGDLIISYLSRWIIPEKLRDRAVFAVNFHPSPPEYRGIGCLNFALYNADTRYGVTVHHLDNEIDHGKIIATRRFDILPPDTVETLQGRTYDHLLVCFYEVMEHYELYGTFPENTAERWSDKIYTRTDLNNLASLSENMPLYEITRRIRATHCKTFPAEIKIGQHRFILKDTNA